MNNDGDDDYGFGVGVDDVQMLVSSFYLFWISVLLFVVDLDSVFWVFEEKSSFWEIQMMKFKKTAMAARRSTSFTSSTA